MRRAFTKYEVLVAFAALGIVTFVLFPVFSRPRESDGPRTPSSVCQSNLKQIGLAFAQYVDDYDEKFPPIYIQDYDERLPLAKTRVITGWTMAVFPYLKSWQIFNCPAAQGEQVDTFTDYFYNSRLAKFSAAKLEDVRFTILSGDGEAKSVPDYAISSFPASWSTDNNSPNKRHTNPSKYWFFQSRTYGANYLFTDGHVKYVSPEKIVVKKPSNFSEYTFLPR